MNSSLYSSVPGSPMCARCTSMCGFTVTKRKVLREGIAVDDDGKEWIPLRGVGTCK